MSCEVKLGLPSPTLAPGESGPKGGGRESQRHFDVPRAEQLQAVRVRRGKLAKPQNNGRARSEAPPG